MGSKLRVVVRDLQPLVLSGLLAACTDCMEIWLAARDKDLLQEVSENQAVAVILNRDYLAEVAGDLPEFIVAVGISSDSDDVVIRKGDRILHLENPHPHALCDVISELIEEHPS